MTTVEEEEEVITRSSKVEATTEAEIEGTSIIKSTGEHSLDPDPVATLGTTVIVGQFATDHAVEAVTVVLTITEPLLATVTAAITVAS
jgi:hypothetical protein